MEQVQALEQITNAHIAYTPMRTMTEDRMPLTPRRGGPVERPLLQGRGHNRLCYNCHKQGHIPNKCIFKRFDALGETTIAEKVARIKQADHTPNWCGKCLRGMPGHKEINCPSYEGCGKCWVHGLHRFLRHHKCVEQRHEEDKVNDPGADIYDYVGSD